MIQHRVRETTLCWSAEVIQKCFQFNLLSFMRRARYVLGLALIIKKNTVIKVIRREKKPLQGSGKKTTLKNINMQITNIIKSRFVHCIHLTNEIRTHQGSWTNQTQYRILQTGFLKIFCSQFICRFSMFAKHNKERGVSIMKHKLSKFLQKQFLWNCWFWGNGCFSLMLVLFVNFKHKLIAKSKMFYKGLDNLHKRTYFFKR